MYRTTKKRKIGRYILLLLVALVVGKRVLFTGKGAKEEEAIKKSRPEVVAEVKKDLPEDSLPDFVSAIQLFPRIRDVFVEKRGDTLVLTGNRKVNLGSGDLMRKLALLDTILALNTSFKSLDFKFKNLVIMR
ncbi:MAG: hypothetical protein DRQ04_01190 [Candidatus Hydrothermota bacterium]|nr:MAG: hypothetical protein DRQ04_01190 [Candidatus Hydrothermae bacterium]